MKRITAFKLILMVFVICFAVIIMATMLYGLQYNNYRIWLLLLICAIYGLLSPMVFSEKLDTKPKYIASQVAYVILLNVTYILVFKIGQIELNWVAYAINSAFTIGLFLVIKLIMFKLDQAEAARITRRLQEAQRRKAQIKEQLTKPKSCLWQNEKKQDDGKDINK